MGTEISKRLNSLPKAAASFVEPMECLSVSKLPAGSQWVWEIKLDGYRALAVKSERGVTLFSRRRKSLNRQSPYIVELLNDLPAEGLKCITWYCHGENLCRLGYSLY
jgi:ATP-dependent DNA ligase